MTVAHAAIGTICVLSLLGMLVRPFRSAEWMWAAGGAAALAAFGLVPPGAAARAVGSGLDVYLFLAGMMALAEIARYGGLFEWLAAHAVAAAGRSQTRLFALVYGVGTLVTIVLSNDATAIVLTPAIAQAAKRARVDVLPYVLACALVANAASFVLPISNPANLIVFASDMPGLGPWLRAFALPSLAAIAVTFGVLFFSSRARLRSPAGAAAPPHRLARAGCVAATGIVTAGVALVATSAYRGPIGAVTAVAALLVLITVSFADRSIATRALRSISWSIVPLVAGLFVLVAGLEATGAVDALHRIVVALARDRPALAAPLVGAIAAFGCNLTNNLPLGVVTGSVLRTTPDAVRAAGAIGIDLGPNLSVTGSLATILWLTALRREDIPMSGARFLRIGALAMPCALAAALATCRW